MNVLDSYHRYFRDLFPVLRDMSKRGIPIDNRRRLELKALIEREDIRVTEEIKKLVPAEILSTKQKGGLKRTPKLKCAYCNKDFNTDHWCKGREAARHAGIEAELSGIEEENG